MSQLLKNELDAKVRQYRLKHPVSALSPEEVNAEAKRCAEKAWKNLRKIFLSSQKKDNDIIIYVGTKLNSINKNPYFVCLKHPSRLNKISRLCRGEILFYEQTMDWLRLIAVDEGITVSESTPLHANLNIAWGYCLSYKPPFDSRY